ncbi:MAG: CotH kinase family protein [Bacteroidota bacterium]|nr:CotH kinase family protein [Bacteroidota bacterium]
MRKHSYICLVLLLLTSGCYKELPLPGQILIDTPDWEASSHSDEVLPDYEKVFPKDQVQRIDLVINPLDWQSFWKALENKLGPFGQSNPGMLEGIDHPYIPVDLFYKGKQWYKVGIRPKGNSSLKRSWQLGVMKLPFKLDFDQFEDQFTNIKDQRFYGFEQLSLKNGYSDPSFIREKVIDELFAEAGLPSVKAAYYQLYIDYGEGQKYFGVYTLVEDVDDTFISGNFEIQGGNIYKPEGQGASFSLHDFNTQDFEQHHSSGLSDYTDIEKLYNILHKDTRLSNPNAWRHELEQVFNTEIFIRWLACNTTVQNWDTYGTIGHNYYLYHDPSDDNLVWIHWDNNNALAPFKFNRVPIEFDFETVNAKWPLIRFLMDDPVYSAAFKTEVKRFTDNYFYPERILPILKINQDMVAPYVVGEAGEKPPYTHLKRPDDFSRERNFIRNFAVYRYNRALDYLEK